MGLVRTPKNVALNLADVRTLHLVSAQDTARTECCQCGAPLKAMGAHYTVEGYVWREAAIRPTFLHEDGVDDAHWFRSCQVRE